MEPSFVQLGSFQVDDYVAYVGNEDWRGFYLVRAINPDGSLQLCDKGGGIISSAQPTALRLLYRPTQDDYSLVD